MKRITRNPCVTCKGSKIGCIPHKTCEASQLFREYRRSIMPGSKYKIKKQDSRG